MNKTLVAIIGMMAFAVNAQTPPTTGGDGGLSVPERLAISMDDLQARAWESVTNVGVFGWSSSSIYATTNDRSEAWSPYQARVVDIAEVFRTIESQSLRLSVLYPSDTIGMACGLFNKNGEILFWGTASGKINPPNTNGVSKNRLDIELNLLDNTWLAFSNAVSYYVVERDTNGYPVRFYNSNEWKVRNGLIRFPNYFSDKNGEIIVRLSDGTEVAYGLGNGGQRIIPTTVKLQAGKVSALGTRTFRVHDESVITCLVISPEEVARNINPICQLVIDHQNPLEIGFRAWSESPNQKENYRFATSVKIWRHGQLSREGTVLDIPLPQYPSTRILLEPGHYWLKFGFIDWPIGNQFSPPYDGNGVVSSDGGSGG